MAERFQTAAQRHLITAELLELANATDDAGYHYGLSGENSVKWALEKSGIAAELLAQGVKGPKSPMRQHFPNFHDFVKDANVNLQLHAQTRNATSLANYLQSAACQARFAGWSIKIRYADTDCPVVGAACAQWKIDAETLFNDLAI